MEAVAPRWLAWLKGLALLLLSPPRWCSSALGEGGGCVCRNAERRVCAADGNLRGTLRSPSVPEEASHLRDRVEGLDTQRGEGSPGEAGMSPENPGK